MEGMSHIFENESYKGKKRSLSTQLEIIDPKAQQCHMVNQANNKVQ